MLRENTITRYIEPRVDYTRFRKIEVPYFIYLYRNVERQNFTILLWISVCCYIQYMFTMVVNCISISTIITSFIGTYLAYIYIKNENVKYTKLDGREITLLVRANKATMDGKYDIPAYINDVIDLDPYVVRTETNSRDASCANCKQLRSMRKANVLIEVQPQTLVPTVSQRAGLPTDQELFLAVEDNVKYGIDAARCLRNMCGGRHYKNRLMSRIEHDHFPEFKIAFGYFLPDELIPEVLKPYSRVYNKINNNMVYRRRIIEGFFKGYYTEQRCHGHIEVVNTYYVEQLPEAEPIKVIESNENHSVTSSDDSQSDNTSRESETSDLLRDVESQIDDNNTVVNSDHSPPESNECIDTIGEIDGVPCVRVYQPKVTMGNTLSNDDEGFIKVTNKNNVNKSKFSISNNNPLPSSEGSNTSIIASFGSCKRKEVKTSNEKGYAQRKSKSALVPVKNINILKEKIHSGKIVINSSTEITDVEKVKSLAIPKNVKAVEIKSKPSGVIGGKNPRPYLSSLKPTMDNKICCVDNDDKIDMKQTKIETGPKTFKPKLIYEEKRDASEINSSNIVAKSPVINWGDISSQSSTEDFSDEIDKAIPSEKYRIINEGARIAQLKRVKNIVKQRARTVSVQKTRDEAIAIILGPSMTMEEYDWIQWKKNKVQGKWYGILNELQTIDHIMNRVSGSATTYETKLTPLKWRVKYLQRFKAYYRENR